MWIHFTEFIYNKSMPGFMEIYGKPADDIKTSGDINPHILHIKPESVTFRSPCKL